MAVRAFATHGVWPSWVALLVIGGCGSTQPSAPPDRPPGERATSSTNTTATVVPSKPLDQHADDAALAGLLDEQAKALEKAAASDPALAPLGKPVERVAAMMLVEWTTVAESPTKRLQAMAFRLGDGRLRWTVNGETSRSAISIVDGILYEDRAPVALWKGIRRPLDTFQVKGCAGLPLAREDDLAALPPVVRRDAQTSESRRVSTCVLVNDLDTAVVVPLIRWVGAALRGNGQYALVTAALGVKKEGLSLSNVAVTPLSSASVEPAPACTAAEECYDLAARTYRGEDKAKAATFYERGCELGLGLSCIQAAAIHETGDGVPKSAELAAKQYARGLDLFEEACAKKDGEGCYYLGISHEFGRGVAIDHAKAVKHYKAGCGFGSSGACFNLGGMYREGKGVKKDPANARKFYAKACDGGDEEGCSAAAKVK